MFPSTSAAIGSSIPSSLTSIGISRFEFNSFHSIDRSLFGRFVFNLNCDAHDSIEVMALLIWLEQSGQSRNFIAFLNSLQDHIILALFNEARICLNCMQKEEFNIRMDRELLTVIRQFTKDQLRLQFFHDNRSKIVPAVKKNVNEICKRAFSDILLIVANHNTRRAGEGTSYLVNQNQTTLPTNVLLNQTQTMSRENVSTGEEESIVQRISQVTISSGGESGKDGVDGSSSNADVSDAVAGSGVVSGGATEEEVLEDDRTIFLTFSKGYPISETEVMNFFTRRFGGIIKEIHMQEVAVGEQPLYARLVLRSAFAVDMMLGGRIKPKFTINGKHVWARKYVRKPGNVQVQLHLH